MCLRSDAGGDCRSAAARRAETAGAEGPGVLAYDRGDEGAAQRDHSDGAGPSSSAATARRKGGAHADPRLPDVYRGGLFQGALTIHCVTRDLSKTLDLNRLNCYIESIDNYAENIINFIKNILILSGYFWLKSYMIIVLRMSTRWNNTLTELELLLTNELRKYSLIMA